MEFPEGDWDDLHLYLDNCDNIDKTTKAISKSLRQMQGRLRYLLVISLRRIYIASGLITDHPSSHLSWVTWTRDLELHKKRNTCWPEGIPPPSVGDTFRNDVSRKALPARNFLAALTGYKVPKIGVESWTKGVTQAL
jgi:hypothetical protein